MRKLVTLTICLSLVFLAFGCCKKAPKEVGEAQVALDAAKDNCAEAYNVAEYDQAESLLREANNFVAEKKCGKAKSSAKEAIEMAVSAEAKANDAMAKAKTDAEASLAAADKAIAEAKAAEAPEYASTTFNSATAKLNEAKSLAQAGSCNYLKVKKLADEAAALALQAKNEAAAEKARLAAEEKARLAAQRRAALEAEKWNNWTVEKGDNLWNISSHKNIYSDPFMWPLIWKANRSQIKDPDLIYPDQKFSIPRDSSDADKKDASRYSKTRYEVWPVPDFLTDGK